jgi:hypothetical protein
MLMMSELVCKLAEHPVSFVEWRGCPISCDRMDVTIRLICIWIDFPNLITEIVCVCLDSIEAIQLC